MVQRCEDDLSHILVNIIKTNNTLKEKIEANSSVADEWAKLLQYHFASLVDNRFPGGASVAQRSGRPLKCIKDRLNGKGGRIRGNLMAKRVDFSARSVITADPNISVVELGIPVKIAKNITKPVLVNDSNKEALTILVRNGADVYPGAKILDILNPMTKETRSITLKYRTDRENIVLQNGDIVHRHILDGDPVLFNRQPTLHRMSMMCHRAKIMLKGETFRLNVAVTKPYNADFDGDEMNMHMPQDVFSDAELLHLAAVPYQLISPANNSTIIGIFQDSMMGTYQFTRDNVFFSARDAMNLLMKFNRLNELELYQYLAKNGKISSREILSQIIPPISLSYKSRIRDCDAEIIIRKGKFLTGQLDKSTLGSKTKGIIHRICNDYGNFAATDFIDDLQNIVTEYLKTTSSFSVGISDLISKDSTKKERIESIVSQRKEDVKNLIQQLQLSVYENNTGKSNREEFETQVNNILNKVSKETQKIGLESLSGDNRFRIMVNAGSKGSELNISQMISCVGQQNVDGKRIPYGFDGRTLPHFTKFDDTPEARGFVANSYMDGLNPQELFFHAMGGRVGLIDTAVKTSTTGYIQRRLIKGLEDLMVNYDMTIRSNKNQIIQFAYGDDCADATKVESQQVPFVKMTLSEIYAHYDYEPDEKENTTKLIFSEDAMKRERRQKDETTQKHLEYIKNLLRDRDNIVRYVFKNRNDSSVFCPVAFYYIIENIRGQMNITDKSISDITLLETYQLIEEYFEKLNSFFYVKATMLMKVLYFFYLSPKQLVYVKRLNRTAIIMVLETVVLHFKKSIVAPGEMVGMIAAQSIGEPTTQMTLNTFHFSGISSKSNVTRGVPRIEEILSLTTGTKNPSLTVYLKPEDEANREKAQTIMYMMEHTKLEDIVKSVEICFDPQDSNTVIEEDYLTMKQFMEFEKMLEMVEGMDRITEKDAMKKKSKWIIRLELNAEVMMEKNITMDDVHFVISTFYEDDISCVYSDYNAEKLIFRIRVTKGLKCGTSQRKPKQRTKQPSSAQKQSNPIAQDDFEDVDADADGDADADVDVDVDVDVDGDVDGDADVDVDTKQYVDDTDNVFENDQTDQIFNLRMFQEQLLKQVVLKGIKKIKKVLLRKVQDNLVKEVDQYKPKEIWVLDTVGTNLLDVLSQEYIDQERTTSNDIVEVLDVFGIEAARLSIFNELAEVIEFDDAYINCRHLSLLCDRMTSLFKPKSICRHGINTDNIGPIAKASFEETPEMFLRAAKHAELDIMRGVSANVLCGQDGYYGTSSFQVMLDVDKLLQENKPFKEEDEEEEEKQDDEANKLKDEKTIVLVETNVEHIETLFLGDCNDSYINGF
jgi:DNA-directed RNA polymerase II subunit RPB1